MARSHTRPEQSDLETLISRLQAAIDTSPRHMDGMARRYLAKLRGLRRHDGDPYVAVMIGPNVYGRGIEHAISMCRPLRDEAPGHSAFNRKLAFGEPA